MLALHREPPHKVAMRTLLACVAASVALLAPLSSARPAAVHPAITAEQSIATIDRALTDAAAKGFGGAHAGSDGTFFSYLGWLRKNDVRLYLVGNNGADEVKPLVQLALKQALQIPAAAK